MSAKVFQFPIRDRSQPLNLKRPIEPSCERSFSLEADADDPERLKSYYDLAVELSDLIAAGRITCDEAYYRITSFHGRRGDASTRASLTYETWREKE